MPGILGTQIKVPTHRGELMETIDERIAYGEGTGKI